MCSGWPVRQHPHPLWVPWRQEILHYMSLTHRQSRDYRNTLRCQGLVSTATLDLSLHSSHVTTTLLCDPPGPVSTAKRCMPLRVCRFKMSRVSQRSFIGNQVVAGSSPQNFQGFVSAQAKSLSRSNATLKNSSPDCVVINGHRVSDKDSHSQWKSSAQHCLNYLL